jgi:F-type H+-transporting ATPase subunit gamma
MSQKTVKAKIRGVEKTRQVTKAMEAVSAARMRKAQDRALTLRPYALSAFNILRRVARDSEAMRHPLFLQPQNGKRLFIVITSDRGLAGNLNNAVLKKVMSYVREHEVTTTDSVFITLGKKATEFFRKKGFTTQKDFSGIPDNVPLNTFEEISKEVVAQFLKGNVREVVVAYSNFLSTFNQEGSLHQILPITLKDVEGVVRGIAPIKGKYSQEFNNRDMESLSTALYLYEPSVTKVLDDLLPYLVTLSLYHGALESKASEHSARMVAMKSAGDKARDIKKDLTRKFNKVRQSAITREVSEIIGGIEALKV